MARRRNSTKARKRIVATRKKRIVKKPVRRAKISIAKKSKMPKKKTAKKIIKKRITSRKKAVRKVAKKIIKKRAIKKATNQIGSFSAKSLFKAKIKVIGVGGGGGSIVSEIGRSLAKATFVIADTDIRALKKKSGIKYLWFGQNFTHGLGTGTNMDLAKQAAEAAKGKIAPYFKDQDIIIFIASLGGGLGSGATQVFAEAAREFGGITVGIFTMPFKFEGKSKHNIAQNALKALRQSLNVSLVLPNEKIFKVIDVSTPITNAFSTVNKSLIESLESLIDLIYNPGIINIDFADLRTILRGRGNSAFLNTIEESGKDRVEKICEKVFKNPLLQTNAFAAEKILFNIAGSENLSMFEVEKISSHIASANPKAKIIFGISKNPKLKNKIKTTILMTGGQIKEEDYEKESVKITASLKDENRSEKEGSVIIKKEKSKQEKNKKAPVPAAKKAKQVSFIPILKATSQEQPMELPILEETPSPKIQSAGRQAIRRNALEIKRAEELQEKKRMAQEKEWEIPAFLRKVKFRN